MTLCTANYCYLDVLDALQSSDHVDCADWSLKHGSLPLLLLRQGFAHLLAGTQRLFPVRPLLAVLWVSMDHTKHLKPVTRNIVDELVASDFHVLDGKDSGEQGHD